MGSLFVLNVPLFFKPVFGTVDVELLAGQYYENYRCTPNVAIG